MLLINKNNNKYFGEQNRDTLDEVPNLKNSQNENRIEKSLKQEKSGEKKFMNKWNLSGI